MRPGHLTAASWPEGHSDHPRIVTARRFFGGVKEFAEHHHFATRHHWAAGSQPYLLRDGTLPVPMLLEYTLATGDWVRPEGHPRQHLVEIADLEVRLPGLVLSDHDGLTLEIDATGSWSGKIWEVRVTAMDGGGGGASAPVATLTLRYGAKPSVIDMPGPVGSLSVAPHSDDGMWCTPLVPRACLPHPTLAAGFRLAAARTRSTPTRLTLRSLVAVPGCLSTDTIHPQADGFVATAHDQAVLRAVGLAVGG
jgi:hypothetical protein